MNVFTVHVTPLQTNCYIVQQDDRAFVIDPGSNAEGIVSKACQLGAKIEAILLTHGHFDHSGAVFELKERTGASVYVSENDLKLANSIKSLSFALGGKVKKFDADCIVQDGEEYQIAGMSVKVIATPGHTSGGVCYIVKDCLFSGDTLFELSYGRTDFPTGNFSDLKNSICKKLFELNGDYTVYTGHGESTTLEYERKNNPINFDD